MAALAVPDDAVAEFLASVTPPQGKHVFWIVRGHSAVPSQVSNVQGSLSLVQAAPELATISVGHELLLPSQVSAKSQPPGSAGRHS
jgi:hypothetical protein